MLDATSRANTLIELSYSLIGACGTSVLGSLIVYAFVLFFLASIKLTAIYSPTFIFYLKAFSSKNNIFTNHNFSKIGL